MMVAGKTLLVERVPKGDRYLRVGPFSRNT